MMQFPRPTFDICLMSTETKEYQLIADEVGIAETAETIEVSLMSSLVKQEEHNLEETLHLWIRKAKLAYSLASTMMLASHAASSYTEGELLLNSSLSSSLETCSK